MSTQLDFKAIVDNFSFAILIASPIYEDNEINDFHIDYTNNLFSKLTEQKIAQDIDFSDLKEILVSNVDWMKFAKGVATSNSAVSTTFFSEPLNIWISLSMKKFMEDRIILTVEDVSTQKEHESLLQNKNKQIESLSDELETNKANLRNKLANIQTLNEQLQYAAYHDTMTNLYNRAWFNKILAQKIESYTQTENKFGIIFIDIDDMKNINDSSGHSAGDDLIRQISSILRKFQKNDILPFRFGGDEFLLLCDKIKNKDSIITIGDAVLEVFNTEGIKISGGISIFPDDSVRAEELLKFADMAMFDVKKTGKNNIAFFHMIMQDKFLKKMNIETKLSKAMDDSCFQLYFQPQFDISTNQLRGFEALLRWYDDTLGWISPEQFIPLAEESKLVIPLGDWVMDKALSTLHKWEEKYNFTGIMSVNVSPVQLRRKNFLENFLAKLTKHNITPSKLEIEITEGIFIDNIQDTVTKLQNIRKYGIGISLDDFGTGYSSLRYLQMLPLTTLKIDKSFIANINSKSGVEANITDSIISMVSKMGLDTIAEGVETDSQLNILKKINCRNIQGFLKGKPMPEDICEKVLNGDMSALITINNDPDNLISIC